MERTLTEADVQAIAEAVASKSHGCQFTEEEVMLVRRWLKKFDRVANVIGYAVLTVLATALLGALWTGLKAKLQGGG
jgi:hypothetical protein